MQRWRKLLPLWVWIMVLVMPLAGLAATTMPCVGGHLPSGAQTDAETSVQAPCHGSGATVASVDISAANDAAAGDSGHFCSACAACFASAALPATVPGLGEPGLVAAHGWPPLLRDAGLVVGGLERPPRAVG
jgi:hypothetical protein